MSFVLERTQPAANTGLFGVFSLAVVMCVCCLGTTTIMDQSKGSVASEWQDGQKMQAAEGSS